MKAFFKVVAQDTNADQVPDILERINAVLKFFADTLLPNITKVLIGVATAIGTYVGLAQGAKSAFGAVLGI